MSQNFDPDYDPGHPESTAHEIRALRATVADLNFCALKIFRAYGGDDFSGRLREGERPALFILPNGLDEDPEVFVMAIGKSGRGNARELGPIQLPQGDAEN